MTSYRDWVVETSNTTGTGTYSLSGSAPAGTSYFRFRERYSNGEDEVCFWAVNSDRTKWEKNQFSTLTYGTPDTLTRNVVESTSGDAAISWVGGDLPLRLYVVPDSAAQEFMIKMGLGATKPDILKFGLWVDEDDVASGIHTVKFFDGVSDATLGKIDTAQHKFTSAFMPCGTILPFIGGTAPAGFVLASGLTIGDASSSATGRANADTKDLFTLLWDNWANGQAAVSGGRGGSAAADFAAHKTIALPDIRGRVIAGDDNMGGTTANRITSTVSPNGQTIGATGGDQTASVSGTGTGSASVNGNTGGPSAVDGPAATPGGLSVPAFFHNHNISFDAPVGVSVSASGSNIQPTIVTSYIIKL